MLWAEKVLKKKDHQLAAEWRDVSVLPSLVVSTESYLNHPDSLHGEQLQTLLSRLGEGCCSELWVRLPSELAQVA